MNQTSLAVSRPEFDGITGPVGFGADSPKPLLMMRLVDGIPVPVYGAR